MSVLATQFREAKSWYEKSKIAQRSYPNRTGLVRLLAMAKEIDNAIKLNKPLLFKKPGAVPQHGPLIGEKTFKKYIEVLHPSEESGRVELEYRKLQCFLLIGKWIADNSSNTSAIRELAKDLKDWETQQGEDLLRLALCDVGSAIEGPLRDRVKLTGKVNQSTGELEISYPNETAIQITREQLKKRIKSFYSFKERSFNDADWPTMLRSLEMWIKDAQHNLDPKLSLPIVLVSSRSKKKNAKKR